MARQREFELRNALALVTGAGSGIGRAICLALAGEGARVLAVDIDRDSAEKTAAACAERGREAHGFVCDVADAAAVSALADQVHETFGPLDVLVNNAGVSVHGRWADMTLDDWNWIRSINLDGVVHGCLAFGPAMLARRRGHVVNISSVLAFMPNALVGAYGATKAAVLTMSMSLRGDWSHHGVGVSVLCPGMINTSIVSSGRALGRLDDKKSQAVDAFRKGRSPETVAIEAIRAIRENRGVVPVGAAAKAGWWGHRLLPLQVKQFIARQGVT